ncbi:MAG: NAD(P)-dependent alcohol dehydrogenase, partial [Actinomycetota bacterium]
MKAIIYHRDGSPDVLRFDDAPAPVVKDEEVLIRVRAASVNPRDWHFLRGLPYVMRPRGLRIP